MFKESDLRNEIMRVKNEKNFLNNELKDNHFKILSDFSERELESVILL